MIGIHRETVEYSLHVHNVYTTITHVRVILLSTQILYAGMVHCTLLLLYSWSESADYCLCTCRGVHSLFKTESLYFG